MGRGALSAFTRTQREWLLLSIFAVAAGCEVEVQSVHIVAQDFRFTPTDIRLQAARPIHLTVVNEGREPHEFESPLLAHRVGKSHPAGGSPLSLRVLPNQRADVVIRTVPGTYVFYCNVRGHTGMSGTIIVE